MSNEANLSCPTARNRLMLRAEPYFRSLEQGLAIGYRRGKKASVWLARLRGNESGAYQEIKIGLADDHMAADGLSVFTFDQAQRQARTVITQEAARRMLGSPEGAEKKTTAMCWMPTSGLTPPAQPDGPKRRGVMSPISPASSNSIFTPSSAISGSTSFRRDS